MLVDRSNYQFWSWGAENIGKDKKVNDAIEPHAEEETKVSSR